MAPELLRGEEFTSASDVYSFGCVLADIAMNGKISTLYTRGSSFPRSPGEFQHWVAMGWRPDLPEIWREELPPLILMITECWQHVPANRPTFSQIKRRLEAWKGETRPHHHYEHFSKYVRHVVTPFSAKEDAFLGKGIKIIFDSQDRKNHSSGPGRLKAGWDGGGNGDSSLRRGEEHLRELTVSYTQKMRHRGWEICELAFDYVHPERRKHGFGRGETARLLLDHNNEHNITVYRQTVSHKGRKAVDLVMKMVWKEVSHGNYVVHSESIERERPDAPPGHKKGVLTELSSTLWVQQSPDGETCQVRSIVTGSGKSGGNKLAGDFDNHFLPFLDAALKRKNNGDWAVPDYGMDVEDLYDDTGFAVVPP